MPKFELEKETAKVKFMLEKKQIPQLTSEVVGIVDVSGSIKTLFHNGTIQKTLQRIVPIALNFDDNGELPVYVFSDKTSQIGEPITAKNFETYVKEIMLKDPDVEWWGGTYYAPVIEDVVRDLGFLTTQRTPSAPVQNEGGFFKKLFGGGGSGGSSVPGNYTLKTVVQQNSTSGYPAIVYFITDGDSSDEGRSESWLKTLAEANSQIYFNFIGVGNASFQYLARIADLYPNVGFARVLDLLAIADSDDIYDYLIPDELTAWLKAFVNVKVAPAMSAGA